MQAQDLFQVMFVDLQLITNSTGSTEINTKEFAASPSSWDPLVVLSADDSSFQAWGFGESLGQFWSKSSSGIVVSPVLEVIPCLSGRTGALYAHVTKQI